MLDRVNPELLEILSPRIGLLDKYSEEAHKHKQTFRELKKFTKEVAKLRKEPIDHIIAELIGQLSTSKVNVLHKNEKNKDKS